jgi:uncharacterized protein YprB with RNaseH-like and TPR domain
MRLENSINFLEGIGEKTEQKLWQNGVTHWDDFRGTDIVSGNRYATALDQLTTAERNLDVGNAAFFDSLVPDREQWRLYQNFQEETAFFDIETTGLDRQKNTVTTVSFYRGGETVTLIQGKDLTDDRLQEELFKSKILVSFNGKRFDQPFLAQNFDVAFDQPHIDLMYDCKRIGLTGGLKAIEQQLGIGRDLDDDVDGKDAIRLWKRYQRHDDEAALEKLVHYNQLDVQNLQPLLEIVHQTLRETIFEPHVPDQ